MLIAILWFILFDVLNFLESGDITSVQAKREIKIFYTYIYIIKDLRDIIMNDNTLNQFKLSNKPFF